MSTTIDLTNYNALVNDDGSNTVGTLSTKAAILLNPILTPVQTAITALDAVDALKAPLASPTFTGTPAAPTAAPGTNTTQLASTAFVAAVAALVPTLPGTSNPTTTGTSTALAIPTGTGNLVIFMNNATLLTVQGITAGLDGQLLTICSKGAGQVDFAHLHASGTALGKLHLFATSGLTSLAAGSGVATFQYDLTLTKWRLVNHDQGAWITRTFAAGNYTASAGTWTVASATRDAYWLKGRTLLFSENASGTTSGTPVTVKVAIPAGFVSAAADTLTFYVQLNGAGGSEGGYVTTAAAGTLASYQRYANVTFAAGTVTVSGLLTFEVQ